MRVLPDERSLSIGTAESPIRISVPQTEINAFVIEVVIDSDHSLTLGRAALPRFDREDESP